MEPESALARVPHDLIRLVLETLHPINWLWFSQTCRVFRGFKGPLMTELPGSVLCSLARGGELDILRTIPWAAATVLLPAAQAGQLEVFKWACEFTGDLCLRDMTLGGAAARGGHANILRCVQDFWNQLTVDEILALPPFDTEPTICWELTALAHGHERCALEFQMPNRSSAELRACHYMVRTGFQRILEQRPSRKDKPFCDKPFCDKPFWCVCGPTRHWFPADHICVPSVDNVPTMLPASREARRYAKQRLCSLVRRYFITTPPGPYGQGYKIGHSHMDQVLLAYHECGHRFGVKDLLIQMFLVGKVPITVIQLVKTHYPDLLSLVEASMSRFHHCAQ